MQILFICLTGGKGNPSSVSTVAALARIERTDFLQPMFIGEVAKVHAELSYASKHSVEVTAYVWAENLINGVKRLTNMCVFTCLICLEFVLYLLVFKGHYTISYFAFLQFLHAETYMLVEFSHLSGKDKS